MSKFFQFLIKFLFKDDILLCALRTYVSKILPIFTQYLKRKRKIKRQSVYLWVVALFTLSKTMVALAH